MITNTYYNLQLFCFLSFANPIDETENSFFSLGKRGTQAPSTPQTRVTLQTTAIPQTQISTLDNETFPLDFPLKSNTTSKANITGKNLFSLSEVC